MFSSVTQLGEEACF